MGKFLTSWQRHFGIVIVLLVATGGCTKAVSTVASRHVARQTDSTNDDPTRSPLRTEGLGTESKHASYSYEFKEGGKSVARGTCEKTTYRFNGKMDGPLVSIGDGKLRVDDKVEAELNDRDKITFDDTGTIAVNGVVVWPDASE